MAGVPHNTKQGQRDWRYAGNSTGTTVQQQDEAVEQEVEENERKLREARITNSAAAQGSGQSVGQASAGIDNTPTYSADNTQEGTANNTEKEKTEKIHIVLPLQSTQKNNVNNTETDKGNGVKDDNGNGVKKNDGKEKQPKVSLKSNDNVQASTSLLAHQK
ncbi:hypothetical protein BS50DRAFT_583712 [Corynespora cassiicola Philippines]|uniref:Uncharacterized protein n=1 Tax=Corynespora cassiicola Philippines TaxID=1448308 RepID=A0A2T2P3C3_CORCC|nr:hypothetical protein BS50DRAFT_583712 [Corynespora cassiicola Philippines]